MRYLGEGCDSLIGLGGGSPMDTAKAIGVVVKNGGSILEYEWADPQPIKKRIPPLITVPTTAGTGSEGHPLVGDHRSGPPHQIQRRRHRADRAVCSR